MLYFVTAIMLGSLYFFPYRIWVGVKTGTIKGRWGDTASRRQEPFWFWFFVVLYLWFTITAAAWVILFVGDALGLQLK